MWSTVSVVDLIVWGWFLQVLEYGEKLLQSKLAADVAKEAAAILADLRSPQSCWEKYLKTDKVADQAQIQEDDFDSEELKVELGNMAEVKEKFPKHVGLLFDFLLEVVSFKYYSDCQDLAAGGSPDVFKALQDLGQADSSTKVPELVKQLHLLTSQFDGHAKSVTASSSAPTPSLLRQLAGSHGQADADGERERLWKVVQQERRRYVSFGVPKKWDKEGLLNCFRGSGKVFAHSGVLNTSHRLFCAAADLWREEGEEPWLNPTVPPEKSWREVTAFINSCTGPTDFAMAFDGRMRDVRVWHVAWQDSFHSACCF